MPFYVGLMSGTSMDGVDAVLVDFDGKRPRLLHHHTHSYPPPLHQRLNHARTLADRLPLGDYATLDHDIGGIFAAAVAELLRKADLGPARIEAIGSHGQTLLHRPEGASPSTIQAGDPNIIAARTGIAVVADLRRLDMALGGQGAPLAPAFHAAVFRTTEHDRVVVNIGGIANVSILPASPSLPITGFDSGPGNALLDDWISARRGLSFDEDGQWGGTGTVSSSLLDRLLADPYFKKPPPKSTGREYFNAGWLQRQAGEIIENLAPQDVQATLLAFTAATVAGAIERHLPGTATVLVCGGGTRNPVLMRKLTDMLSPREVSTTARYGIAPESIEAMMCAWLARCRMEEYPASLPSVTGASGTAVLGGLYLPPTR